VVLEEVEVADVAAVVLGVVEAFEAALQHPLQREAALIHNLFPTRQISLVDGAVAQALEPQVGEVDVECEAKVPAR
jgi:hypothetical protein